MKRSRRKDCLGVFVLRYCARRDFQGAISKLVKPLQRTLIAKPPRLSEISPFVSKNGPGLEGALDGIFLIGNEFRACKRLGM